MRNNYGGGLRAAIWDVFYPLLVTILSLVIATMLITIVIPLLPVEFLIRSGIGKAMPLLVNILFYGYLIITQRKQYHLDSLRTWQEASFESTKKRAIYALLFSACFGDLLTRVIYASGLPDLFTGYDEAAASSFENQNLFLLVFVVVILAPLAEELMFRGLLYRRASMYMGKLPAVLFSAACFGLYHMNVVQFVFATILGITFGYVYEQTRNLWIPILMHMGANGFSVLASDIISMQTGPIYIIILGVEIVAVCYVAFMFCREQKTACVQ